MKKILCILVIVLFTLLTDSIVFAHCHGPHGPRDIQSEGKK
jgi:hypothetical protein